MADGLNWKPKDGMRASWSTCTRTPCRFTGVIKENGTDAWLWHCERARHHAHETRAEALACARERIALEGDRGRQRDWNRMTAVMAGAREREAPQRDEILSVPCPACGAPVGEPCPPSWTGLGPHADRAKAAEGARHG